MLVEGRRSWSFSLLEGFGAVIDPFFEIKFY